VSQVFLGLTTAQAKAILGLAVCFSALLLIGFLVGPEIWQKFKRGGKG
jgi:hypothetical protein